MAHHEHTQYIAPAQGQRRGCQRASIDGKIGRLSPALVLPGIGQQHRLPVLHNPTCQTDPFFEAGGQASWGNGLCFVQRGAHVQSFGTLIQQQDQTLLHPQRFLQKPQGVGQQPFQVQRSAQLSDDPIEGISALTLPVQFLDRLFPFGNLDLAL